MNNLHSPVTIAFVSAFVVLLASCATTEKASSPSIATRTQDAREEVARLIEEGKAEQALQRISTYRRRELLEEDTASRFFEDAGSRLAENFRKAVEEERYRDAIRLHGSLEAVGELDRIENANLNTLYLGLADSYAEQDNFVASLHSFARIPEMSQPASEHLLRYGEMAREHQNRFVVEKVVSALSQQDEEVPNELEEFVGSEPRASKMISGTATVWVNRGIRIDQGVGYPDRAIGSGFFIDRRGYLITNYHVIESEVDPTYEGYSRLFVRLPNSPNSRTPARVVGYDRIFDVALLKIEIDPPYVFSFTNVRTLEPGAEISAIGSPGGLESSISRGIISATNRRFLQLGDAMQVDVPINPGNSGGPLIDSDGKVVGLVFAGIEQFEGVNFAIPAFWIQRFLPELYNEGEVSHSWMGVATYERKNGLEVMYVAPGSPASSAGLQPGDVITSIAGNEPRKIADAQEVLLDRDPGGLIQIEWERNGSSYDGLVALDERPFSPVEEALKTQPPEDLFPVLFGMRTREVSALPWQSDFVITEIYPGEVADETGLSEQDPLTLRNFEVNEERRIALARILVKKRKAGFVETGIQLGSYLEVDNFL